MSLWILFFLLTGIIFFTGKNLVKYGDILAEKLKLGRTIIGIVFVASITSLPELITGISSVTYADSPDLAAGGVFGSCMFNLLILALLDGFYRDKPISTKVHHGLTLSATFGIILIAVSVLGVFFADRSPVILWMSAFSPLIIAVYILAVWIITNYEKRLILKSVKETAQELMYEKVPLREAVWKYFLNSSIIVVASVFLPKIGKEISHSYGLTETFFGTFFMAFSTSLPEVAVSIAAVKMNMVTIAVANLLGSNIFNVFVLAINDVFYTKGSLFEAMDPDNLFTSILSVLMTSIVIIGLIYRAERKPLRLAFESIALILIYITGLIVLENL